MFLTLVFMALCPFMARTQVVDSVDVLDYDLSFDLSNGSPFVAYADINMKLLRPCSTVEFMLTGTVDSVRVNGVLVDNPNLEALPTASIVAGTDFHVQVWYHGRRNVESYGWGGFHFDSDMHYNLGVGFDVDPHSMGRAMFPCRDNFHDKSTYTLRVKTAAGWTAECGGLRQSLSVDSTGCEESVWRISQPTSNYLVSVSQANWTRIEDTIVSLYGSYPLTIGYQNRQEQNVRDAFAELGSVVPMFERCFGPYRWNRIGYIATRKGSMEHVNNIALDRTFIASLDERAQSTIAHELGHAWFGNLITCEEEGDMWINEGGASFTAEVAMESVLGRVASDDYYQRYLESVLRKTHITDGRYRALHGMHHSYTYGSTTYQKGWMVWHSLRGILGEEVFYNAMNTLMERCAFSTLNAYQLRDSLSSYTGVNLTDFFDFHVFTPGFVDYQVELNQNVLNIRAQGVGTTQIPASHHVPVTLYGRENEMDSVKLWLEFRGSEATFPLMSAPGFCVLDRDFEFSDAATVSYLQHIGFNIRVSMPIVHMTVSAADTVKLRVEHHMAPSMGEMPEGVVRRANRYWMLRGQWTANDSVNGWFRFVRTGYASSSYEDLDRGFYSKAATADSLGLFYRRNSSCPWVLVSRTRSGDVNEGFLLGENLEPGEYTLAVVDFENLAVPQTAVVDTHLFPNPLKSGQALTVEVASEASFTVTIFDAGGRQVWQKTGCQSGQKLNPGLEKGTYFVRIENNFISLQSKLIQL